MRETVIASIQHVHRDDWGDSHGSGWSLSLTLEPRDLWIGVYWDRSASGGTWDVYVCLLPCLPIHLCYWTGR